MLLAKAELVGEAIVLSRESGRARIRFTRLLKGRPRVGGLVGATGLYRISTVAYRSRGEPIKLGDWWDEDCFVPGNRILTHLAWSSGKDCYEAVWWNATSVLEKPGD
jgi:hypothetical protein